MHFCGNWINNGLVRTPSSGKSWICHRFITARIRSMMERYCFHRCLSVNILWGVPHPGLDGGGYPRYPPTSRPSWGTPFKMGYPPPSRHDQGTPHLGMGYSCDLGCIPHHQDLAGVPPPTLGWGTPLPDLGWGTPPWTEQHSEHLLRGGRYASCVHAGGLSC